MVKALWTPEAREDLKAIALYIGRKDRRVATAGKLAREIKAKCDDYATAFATGNVVGAQRPELGENHRVSQTLGYHFPRHRSRNRSTARG